MHVLRNGATERFVYDAMGRLLTHWLPSHVGDRASVRYTYYPNGHVWEDQVRTMTDPLGRVTTYEYDVVWVFVPPVWQRIPRSGRGLVTKITYADGSTRSVMYSIYGKKRIETDETGDETTTTYDPYQRVQTITDPVGRVTTHGYQHKSNLSPLAFTSDLPAKITLPGVKLQTMVYDAKFRLLSRTEGNGTDAATTQFAYDSRDNLIRQTDPLGRVTSYGHDARNRVIRQTDPGNLTTTFSYDDAGNRTRVTHPDQTSVAAAFDAMNRVARRTNEANLVTTYEYTGDDQIAWVTDPAGKRTGYQYDAEGRVVQRNSPAPSGDYRVIAVYTYDLAGNLVGRVDNRNVVTTYGYDVRNREVTRTYSDGTPAITTSYDAAGRVTQEKNSVSTLTYRYNAASQVTSERQRVSGGLDKTVSYTFHADGNRATLSSPDVSLSYVYTTRNQVSLIADDGNGFVIYAYALDGQLLAKILGNGSSTTYSYDATGRLSLIDESRSPDRSYQYDVRGRKTQVSVGSGMFVDTYRYSTDSQLIQHVTSESFVPPPTRPPVVRTYDFAYDGSGNRTTATTTGSYTSNGANQYTKLVGGITETFAYDAVGNMTQRGSLSLLYDAESRLLGSDGTGLSYDPQGRLVKITSGSTVRTAVYDEKHAIAWYDGTNNLIEKTYWGAKGDEPFFTHRTAGNASLFWHLDAHNSIAGVTDASRNNLEVYFYGPYGEVSFVDVSNVPWKFRTASVVNPMYRFTGQQWLGDLGVFHYRARAYDPRLGRFLQHDPSHLEAGDTNLYRYVRNNPTNYIDSDGEIFETLWDLANVAMDAASLARNIVRRDWSGAAADAAALVIDGAATVVPGVPGGAGAGLKAVRAADHAVDSMKGVERAGEASKVASEAARRPLGPHLSEMRAARGSMGPLADDALVCRGGTCTADRFAQGSGVMLDEAGRLQGVSVNSAPGATLNELTTTIPNKQVGVSTVGRVRAVGGDVTPSPTRSNPYHCTMCGISPERAEDLLTPTVRNPNAR